MRQAASGADEEFEAEACRKIANKKQIKKSEWKSFRVGINIWRRSASKIKLLVTTLVSRFRELT